MKQTELIVLEVTINTTKLALTVAYRPPQACFKIFEDEIGKIMGVCKHVIIMGDMNYDLLSSKPHIQKFRNMISSYNLSICQLQATYHTPSSHSWLDLILTTHPEHVIKHGQLSASGISFHDLIFGAYSFSMKKSSTSFNKKNLHILANILVTYFC